MEFLQTVQCAQSAYIANSRNGASVSKHKLADASSIQWHWQLRLQSVPYINQSIFQSNNQELFKFFHVIDATLVRTLLHGASITLALGWGPGCWVATDQERWSRRSCATAAACSDGRDWPAHCSAGIWTEQNWLSKLCWESRTSLLSFLWQSGFLNN